MQSNMKLIKKDTPYIPKKSSIKYESPLGLSSVKIMTSIKQPISIRQPSIRQQSIKQPSIRPFSRRISTISHRRSSTISPRRSSTISPRRISTISPRMEEPSIDLISDNDISNIDSEIRSSTLPPPYNLSPPPAYEMEDALPTIKKMSMVDYDDNDALSYRKEDLSYRV